MGDIVEEVLRMLFSLLSPIEYDYSIMDSTKFADWFRGLHELFINVRGGSTLFPVHAQLTGSEVEFVRGIPEGSCLVMGHSTLNPC